MHREVLFRDCTFLGNDLTVYEDKGGFDSLQSRHHSNCGFRVFHDKNPTKFVIVV